MSAPPGQTLLGTQSLLKRLGITGRQQFTVADQVQPVMQVGSVADLVGEPWEARGIFYVQSIGPTAGKRAALEIYSLARGGFVLESLVFSTGNAGDRVRINTTAVGGVLRDRQGVGGDIIGLYSMLDTGGEQTVSQVWAGQTSLVFSGPITPTATEWNLLGDAIGPIYVPAGASLVLAQQNLSTSIVWAIGKIREIPEAIGG